MEQQIIDVVKKVKPDYSGEVAADSDLLEVLGFDSVNMLELITELEEQFKITFEDDDLDLDNFKNVKNMTQLINKYASSKPQ